MTALKVLIAYSSRFGHSLKIAETIGNVFTNHHIAVDIYNLEAAVTLPNSMKEYDAVIIIASIRYGKFHKNLHAFIASHKEDLQNCLDVFIPVSLTARKPHKRLLENNHYVNKFLTEVNWQSSKINIMPGALEYPKYNILDRSMIKFIMWMTKGEMDTSKTIDYTDWNQVNLLAQEVYSLLYSKNI
ncbi:menaquinone-dependent protoporphyrinogen IX dehydrogenase [Wohlfahrtiimonas larvae]|uniref:Protoporphyrinogen IX dehydrogenase [quinone] n=1 Tax=Wohlfahrtiimonas larvae TaxID=1157986 RepID=A0ABP9MBY2_9GAMM|nr:menaquinone-dependent protoporphyrinogen IX dehydrogenase [Wohlfahrtiimonas larvae]